MRALRDSRWLFEAMIMSAGLLDNPQLNLSAMVSGGLLTLTYFNPAAGCCGLSEKGSV